VPKRDDVIEVSEKTGNKRAAALAATAAKMLDPGTGMRPLLINAAA